MQYSALDNPIIVPVQKFAYETACAWIQPDNSILDVGFGLGYGMKHMHDMTGASLVMGVDVDLRAVGEGLIGNLAVLHYDGKHLPFSDECFDTITCIDVLEHVADYVSFLNELYRVARHTIIISTPNRRPENTHADGTPKNYWHLREWSFEELDTILKSSLLKARVTWQFINQTAPDTYTLGHYGSSTQALMPITQKGLSND